MNEKGWCEVCGIEIDTHTYFGEQDCGCLGLSADPLVCSRRCYGIYMSNIPRHTLGPWSSTSPRDFTGTIVSYIHAAGDPEKMIAQTRGQTTGQEDETAANAQLMAAAPEMYDVLLAIESWKGGQDNEFCEDALDLLNRLRKGGE